jgi:hypothetical protein
VTQDAARPHRVDARALDRLDIVDVCTRWHRAVDRKEFGMLAQILTEVVSLPTLAEVAEPGFSVDTYVGRYERRRDDIIRLYPPLLEGLITQHLVAGHLVDISTGGTTAVCHAHSINVHLPVGGGERIEHGNEYRFDLVRTNAGWRVRGRATWQRWSSGDTTHHDVTAKQRQWASEMEERA